MRMIMKEIHIVYIKFRLKTSAALSLFKATFSPIDVSAVVKTPVQRIERTTFLLDSTRVPTSPNLSINNPSADPLSALALINIEPQYQTNEAIATESTIPPVSAR